MATYATSAKQLKDWLARARKMEPRKIIWQMLAITAADEASRKNSDETEGRKEVEPSDEKPKM